MSTNRKRKEQKRARRKRKCTREQAKRSQAPPRIDILLPPRGLPKISERLIEVAGAALEEAATDDDRRFVLDLAATAWNASLSPPDQRREELEEALREFMPDDTEGRAVLRGYLAQMVSRKLAMYPEDPREVLGFDLSDRGDEFYLQVMSSVA